MSSRLKPDFLKAIGVSTFILFLVLFFYQRWVRPEMGLQWNNGLFPDLAQFYVAGAMTTQDRLEELYDPAAMRAATAQILSVPETSYRFLYPPFVAFACVPLTSFQYETTAWIYFAFNLMLGLALGWRIASEWIHDPKLASTACWIFAGSLPFWRCLLFGQNGMISLALVWLFYRAWKRGYFWVSGLCLALTLFKPHLFIGLYLWVLLFGPNATRAGLALGGGALAFLGRWHGGWDLWREWFHTLASLERLPERYDWMHSVRNMFQLWFPRGMPPGMELLAKFAWLCLVLCWLVSLARLRWHPALRRAAPEVSMGLALFGGLWLTPRVYGYDLVLLFPVLVAWWKVLQARGSRAYGQEMLAWIWIGFYANDFLAWIDWPVVTLFGIFLLGWYCRVIEAETAPALKSNSKHHSNSNPQPLSDLA